MIIVMSEIKERIDIKMLMKGIQKVFSKCHLCWFNDFLRDLKFLLCCNDKNSSQMLLREIVQISKNLAVKGNKCRFLTRGGTIEKKEFSTQKCIG